MVWAFIFILGFIAVMALFAYANKVQRQRVQEKFSSVPDVTKDHALNESVLIGAPNEKVWHYLTDAGLYKQWHPTLKEVKTLEGKEFALGARMAFVFDEGNRVIVDATVIARAEKEHLAFRCVSTGHLEADRFEWLLLKKLASNQTELRVINDYQYDSGRSSGTDTMLLHMVGKAYKKTLQVELAALQQLLQNSA